MPDPQVIPYLLYRDAGAAMDWLIEVFGMTERLRKLNADGTVNHGELVFSGGGVVMVGGAGPDYRGPAELGAVTQSVCVAVEGLDVHRARMAEAGGQPGPVVERDYNLRMYSVEDLEGQVWYFTEQTD